MSPLVCGNPVAITHELAPVATGVVLDDECRELVIRFISPMPVRAVSGDLGTVRQQNIDPADLLVPPPDLKRPLGLHQKML